MKLQLQHTQLIYVEKFIHFILILILCFDLHINEC